jgi:hypothetical protein
MGRGRREEGGGSRRNGPQVAAFMPQMAKTTTQPYPPFGITSGGLAMSSDFGGGMSGSTGEASVLAGTSSTDMTMSSECDKVWDAMVELRSSMKWYDDFDGRSKHVETGQLTRDPMKRSGRFFRTRPDRNRIRPA